ncbi:proline--tRNA ligase [Mycoplasma miroungirhinis]|uniref:Proline--tRNA ligase n=1 Tax=Mycoplasma miroungirhinis TaxID=754516 RepID=A0A6M4JCW4_9MOLU|nr:proline--tRNA ligase [Mycoplasma miroungirhinis]QJR43909.1 proline--tRNA ligase [Mycoplasma miroungirhinis]
MAKKLEKITPLEEDFSKWYLDVIKNGDLISYGKARGTIIFKPLSYGIWENIQKNLDTEFKKQGVKNVYFPLLIPDSLIQKEKDHLKGFNPELATVTEVGGRELSEKYYIRPTSEVLFSTYFKDNVESYNDLPLIYNQWANVIRWEKTTNPFLRTTEFLWQEGHTVHADALEARKLTKTMLRIYANFLKKYLSLPVIQGKKTPREKFSGACSTYTIEAMMKDGRALQAGTSHYLAQNFTKVFDITFKNKENKREYAYGTSWGVTTRLIGALIMAHGDDRGIIIPPKVAPVQIDILEIFGHKNPEVKEFALQVKKYLSKFFRVELDSTDKNPGFKASNSEIHGTPLRIEIGAKEAQTKEITLIRRDTLEKQTIKFDKSIKLTINKLFNDIHKNLYDQAQKRMLDNIVTTNDYQEFKQKIAEGKWVIIPFCGDEAAEEFIQQETGATARCIPFKDPIKINKKSSCVIDGTETKRNVIFAKSY